MIRNPFAPTVDSIVSKLSGIASDLETLQKNNTTKTGALEDEKDALELQILALHRDSDRAYRISKKLQELLA